MNINEIARSMIFASVGPVLQVFQSQEVLQVFQEVLQVFQEVLQVSENQEVLQVFRKT